MKRFPNLGTVISRKPALCQPLNNYASLHHPSVFRPNASNSGPVLRKNSAVAPPPVYHPSQQVSRPAAPAAYRPCCATPTTPQLSKSRALPGPIPPPRMNVGTACVAAVQRRMNIMPIPRAAANLRSSAIQRMIWTWTGAVWRPDYSTDAPPPPEPQNRAPGQRYDDATRQWLAPAFMELNPFVSTKLATGNTAAPAPSAPPTPSTGFSHSPNSPFAPPTGHGSQTQISTVQSSGSVINISGVSIQYPAELNAVFSELQRERGIQSSLEQISKTHKTIRIQWSQNPNANTNTMGSTITLARHSSSRESESDYLKRAIQVELGNMADQENMGRAVFGNLLLQSQFVDQEEDPEVVIVSNAAKAISIELREMAHCIEAYLRDGTSYAGFFAGRSSVSALDWIEIQRPEHTVKYDTLANRTDWRGLEILGVYQAVLASVPVSLQGAAQLKQVASQIQHTYIDSQLTLA